MLSRNHDALISPDRALPRKITARQRFCDERLEVLPQYPVLEGLDLTVRELLDVPARDLGRASLEIAGHAAEPGNLRWTVAL